MNLRIALSACLLFVCFSATAQQPSSTVEPATREQVLKMLELTGSKQNVTLLLNGMKQSMKDGIWASIKAKYPDTPQAMIDDMNGVLDQAFDSLKADEMLELVVPIYEKHLTKTEADAFIRFYSSPEGSSVLKKLPTIMQESMQAGSKYGQDAMARVTPDLDRRVNEIVRKYTEGAARKSEAKQAPATAK